MGGEQRGGGLLRILFANSIQMFGGAEVWFLTIARALRQRGHWVGLVCRRATELAARAREEGIPVFPFRFGADVGPLSVARACSLLRRLRPQAVITNQDKELRTFGLASRLTGIGAVVHRRAIDHPLKNNLRYRLTYTWLARAVVANSESTRRTLVQSAPWLERQRLEVIYNGVDPRLFEGGPDPELRATWGCGDGCTVVGFVGQLDERKGIQILLPAFERVAARVPGARLVLVGRGPLASLVEQFQRNSPVGGRVVLAGFQRDIPRIMRSIDVLVLPSLWEGFGIVLIEAMAAGKPVVASDVSSIPEIVVADRTGLLVPPNDVEALARALERVLGDCALAARLGAAGRVRVRELFTLDRMVDRWERLVKEVVEQQGSAAFQRGFC